MLKAYWGADLHADAGALAAQLFKVKVAGAILAKQHITLTEETTPDDPDLRRWVALIPEDQARTVLRALADADALPSHVDVPATAPQHIRLLLGDLGVSHEVEELNLDSVTCPQCGDDGLYIEARLAISYDEEHDVLQCEYIEADYACPMCDLFGFDEETEKQPPYDALTRHVARLHEALAVLLPGVVGNASRTELVRLLGEAVLALDVGDIKEARERAAALRAALDRVMGVAENGS